MAYIVSQIKDLVNDAVSDAIGKTSHSELDTTSVASLGKAISSQEAFEGFFKSLTNRIVKTVYFVRVYDGKTRSVLRDEHEYGAFIQKVYYTMPEAVENATWDIPNSSDVYAQASPYDVEGTVAVSALTFGGKGTWTIEVIRPIEQIKTAFLDWSSMSAFIDGIYVTIENAFKLEEERLTATAVNTAIALALTSSNTAQKRNLLAEYNAVHTDATLTVAKALQSAEFYKYASMEIKRVIDNMSNMSTIYNKEGYATFTSRENMVVEILSQFASGCDSYLQADTYHNEITSLPNFESVPFFQSSGSAFAFADCSKINIKHDNINSGSAVEQSGIVAFVHDIENVAAHFGNRRSWEMVNPRSEVLIHGEKAEKGFAIDGHANAVVFYIAE